MGMKSTHYIKRKTAIEVILSKVYNCTDEQLENMLESFDESEYRNYWIVETDGGFDEEEELNIRDINRFNQK